MPARDKLPATAGNDSLWPSSEVVKTISCDCKSMSATANRCPWNDIHLKDKERADVETQVAAPGAALEGCPFRAFANNPRGFRAKWSTRPAGRYPKSR